MEDVLSVYQRPYDPTRPVVCLLLTTHDRPETDITESVTARPMHQELLAALSGEATSLYSTNASLETATLLLQARDTNDQTH